LYEKAGGIEIKIAILPAFCYIEVNMQMMYSYNKMMYNNDHER